jgi:cysteine desulfurase/selenocysteine lyase
MSILSRPDHALYPIEQIRADFPILSKAVRGKPLVYLDSTASAMKPQVVIDAESQVYEEEYANIHRGLYYLSERATARYEESRRTVQLFLGAAHAHEIIFTRNTTESINLVAASYGRKFLSEGDEILITALEHHSNIVPWQFLVEEKGVVLKVAPVGEDGTVLLEEFGKLLSKRTKIVAIAHISNVLGTILPVEAMIKLAHDAGAKVLVDGAQAVMHQPVDVVALDADFYAFSAHKLYGPSGIGVLYGKAELLNAMPPYQGGGDMIATVSFAKSTWAPLPAKFEAGTPAIAQAAGLAAAIDYVQTIGLDRIAAHEQDLLDYATIRLNQMEGLRIIGTAPHKAAVISFVLDYAHPHDIAQIFDSRGVAIRAGHHCAQPLMQRFNVPATARASFGLYNQRSEVDALVAAIGKVEEMFRG